MLKQDSTSSPVVLAQIIDDADATDSSATNVDVAATEKKEVSLPASESEKVVDADLDEFPDGGLRAWLVVTGVS